MPAICGGKDHYYLVEVRDKHRMQIDCTFIWCRFVNRMCSHLRSLCIDSGHPRSSRYSRIPIGEDAQTVVDGFFAHLRLLTMFWGN